MTNEMTEAQLKVHDDIANSSVSQVRKQEYGKTESTTKLILLMSGTASSVVHVMKDASPALGGVGGGGEVVLSFLKRTILQQKKCQSSETHKKKLSYATEEHRLDKDVVFNMTDPDKESCV